MQASFFVGRGDYGSAALTSSAAGFMRDALCCVGGDATDEEEGKLLIDWNGIKIVESELQTVLTVTFVACFLIANILAGKQFQLPFGITMTGAVIIFPMTYILSDIFSEVYGYRWSRLT